jgi:thiosulfate/3-mercaptopyruvate sulfurtransferase
VSYTTLVDVATLRRISTIPDWLVVDVRHQLADTGYGERAMPRGTSPAPSSCIATATCRDR